VYILCIALQPDSLRFWQHAQMNRLIVCIKVGDFVQGDFVRFRLWRLSRRNLHVRDGIGTNRPPLKIAYLYTERVSMAEECR